MSESITVFTTGGRHVTDALVLTVKLHYPSSTTILGVAYGTGTYDGIEEDCGTVVVLGLTKPSAILMAGLVAKLTGEDCIGVLHEPTGRTLAVPHATELNTFEEL